MRLYTQFLLVFLALFAAGLGSIVFNKMDQNRHLDRIDDVRAKEFEQTFQEIIDLKVSKTDSYAYDYSYWDEMVAFVSSHDPDWAIYNINTTMGTFGADYVYVVDPQGKMVYRAASKGAKGDVFAQVSPRDFDMRSPRFRSYFVNLNGMPVQVFIAPIQRSDDVKRTGKIYGYLVVAKRWTPEFIGEFTKITKQHVELLPERGGHYDYLHPLKGREGESLFVLGVTFSTTAHDLLGEMYRHNLYALALIGLLGMFLLGMFIYRTVIVPLDNISSALEHGETERIERHTREKGEFGRIARLVKRFYLQQSDLLRQLQRADIAEKEQRELRRRLENVNAELERKVEERTRALEEVNRTLDQRVLEEIRKRHRQERLLVQQNRLASMGEMIGNIAHQWRQPLNSLGLIVQDAEEAYLYGELDQAYVNTMVSKAMEQINYMSRTIDDFRTFFNPNKTKCRFSVRESLENVIEIASAATRQYGIEWVVSIPDELVLWGYPNEFGQVMFNLISNARDAFAENKTVCPAITIDGTFEEGRVRIRVSDNAGGIPEALLPKIFDPYFTTKGESKGAGIGLYMVKMIIEEHMGGTIEAENAGRGARFVLTFDLPETGLEDASAGEGDVVA